MDTLDRAQVMPLLVAACESFRPTWEQYSRDPDFESGLVYVHLGEFARHVVGLLSAGTTSEFPTVFEAVEQLHVRGDTYVREATTVGFLESLQNHAEHNGVDPSAFRPFLRSESRIWWDKLNRFWDGGTSALRDHPEP